MPTFDIIRDVVIANDLNQHGFTRNQIVMLLQAQHAQVNLGTVRTFIGKHALHGGNKPVLYFEKIAHGLYIIQANHL